MRPPTGMEPERFATRRKLFEKLIERSQQREYASDYQQESLLRSLDRHSSYRK